MNPPNEVNTNHGKSLIQEIYLIDPGYERILSHIGKIFRLIYYNCFIMMNLTPFIIFNSLKLLRLTMWNRFVHDECREISDLILAKPIILGTRIKVSSYNGTSC